MIGRAVELREASLSRDDAANDVELVALLREAVSEIRAIRENLERLVLVKEPPHADDRRAWLRRALPELQRMPSFSAATAIARAVNDEPLHALLAEYRRPHGSMALSRRLAAASGIVVDSRVLVRRGDYRGTATYCVRTSRTSGEQNLIERTADFVNQVRRRVAAKASRP